MLKISLLTIFPDFFEPALAEGMDPNALAEAIVLAANQLLLRDNGRPKHEGGKPPVGDAALARSASPIRWVTFSTTSLVRVSLRYRVTVRSTYWGAAATDGPQSTMALPPQAKLSPQDEPHPRPRRRPH